MQLTRLAIRDDLKVANFDLANCLRLKRVEEGDERDALNSRQLPAGERPGSLRIE